MSYQTDVDRRNQHIIGDIVAEKWQCRVRHYDDPHSEIDSYITALTGDEVKAFVEIKARTQTVDAFPTIWLSCRKYDAINRRAYTSGIRGLFIVRFDTEIRWIDVALIDPYDRIRMGGRTDRPDSVNGREPMVCVPVDYMRPL